MHYSRINGRAARVWETNPRTFIRGLKDTGELSAKGISWALLEEAADDMESESDGDSAPRNFSLSVFENALDWELGIAYLNALRAYARAKPGYWPKTLSVAVTRSGDVYSRFGSGEWRSRV